MNIKDGQQLQGEVRERALALKADTLAVMDGMKSFTTKYSKENLPVPSNNFILSETMLSKGDFNLAVCGKVKNGKSSLINALIGREILPVCNDVATSRVFRISNADEESFYVIYANGDKKEISLEELASYGSQAEINNTGEIMANQSIAYIQVNTKIDFLPDGVSLIDTPGIGSTYPQHTAITRQYIKEADGALFVMNPAPLEKVETDFIKEVVEATPGIIFVTTKTDQYSMEVVDETMSRNKELISKAVGEKFVFGFPMLKMSSTLLLSAAHATDENAAKFNYAISGYADVKQSIQDVVFLTQGYYRAGVAYNNAVEYYQIIRKSLLNRKEASEQAATQYQQLLERYNDANARFSTSMGKQRQAELSTQVNTVLTTMSSDFNDIFSTTGIYAKYKNEINALTQDEIAGYKEHLGENVVADVKAAWEDLTKLVYDKISDLLSQYNEECRLAIPETVSISVTNSDTEDPDIQGIGMHDRIGKMRTEMFMGTAVTTALGTVVGGAYFFVPSLITPILPVLAPVMVVLGVGAVLWGAIAGNSKAKAQKLQNDKSKLLTYVQNSLTSCKKQIAGTSLANDKYQSLYQGFITSVKEQADASITSIYSSYKKELDAMKASIMAAKKDSQYIKVIEQMISEWNVNKDKLNKIHESIEAINVE